MDVEDVLSSIRRLVSEESKGQDIARESARQAAEKTSTVEDNIALAVGNAVTNDHGDPAGIAPSNDIAVAPKENSTPAATTVRPFARPAAVDGDKLVLTAALRVVEPDGDAAAKNAPHPIRPERLHLRPVTDQPPAPDDTAVAGSDQEPAVDIDLGGAIPAEEPTSSHPDADEITDAGAADLGKKISSEDDVVLRTASRARIFQVAPDEILFDRASREMDAANQTGAHAKPAFDNGGQDEIGGNSDANWSNEPSRDSDFDISHRDLTPETDPLDTPPEPVSAPQFAKAEGAPNTRGLRDDPKPAAEPDPDIGATEAGPHAASTVNFTEQEDSVLDEDALRDMVSEMVREELQGELGDRITRNVRKLVRREIQRSLASREFE